MDDSNTANQENELLQLVTFGIGEEEFGIDILKRRICPRENSLKRKDVNSVEF